MSAHVKLQPRIIIHGGAGNIKRENMSLEEYQEYRQALIGIVTKTHTYMTTPKTPSSKTSPFSHLSSHQYPSALESAVHAVTQLEDNALFNSGHGAVFTRDGYNELEASVMVSRGYAKRGVGVTGLRHVKNPILLAKAMLEHGNQDLGGEPEGAEPNRRLNVPSAQGHTLIHGPAAGQLAVQYGLETVDPAYFFTQRRWDEHIRGLEKEKTGKGVATWCPESYFPQGTCGAVALDENGVVCVATSTGGITNKLTGRIGDTPVVGAGFWAEEWTERGDPSGVRDDSSFSGAVVQLTDALKGLLADCLPTPSLYRPVAPLSERRKQVYVTRSTAVSGTGNGDSFMRLAAARSVGAMAQWAGISAASAVEAIAGRGGQLQQSAGHRWGIAGEGEGGMIGIESVVAKNELGEVLYTRSDIVHDHNCAGMFRAWIDDDGQPRMQIWHDEGDAAFEKSVALSCGEGKAAFSRSSDDECKTLLD
ncbi:L-asparaginase precursor [Xylariaceae sp. FL1019]|nr:L-asparaginase precursor [Xylariaceae sp. FL1019]